MRANIKGLVERLKLANGKGMMPLYEAISNAMDAINEAKKSGEKGSVEIRLIPLRDLAADNNGENFLVDGFEIRDNGIGLDAKNLENFREAHTLSKLGVGGKGVGRFTYLKVFDQVHITSVYEENGQRFQRDFPFEFADDNLTKADTAISTDLPNGTAVIMKGMASQYRVSWPQDVEQVARRIIDHFLIRFASRTSVLV